MKVQSEEDRSALHSIRDTLRDCRVHADVNPPYEAPIPVWYRTIGFGDADENGWPFTLDLTADGCEITDRAGDPVGIIAGIPAEGRIAACVALALEVAPHSTTKRDPNYLSYTRVLPDGRTLDVAPLLFDRAKLLLSADSTTPFVSDGWCYDDPNVALEQWATWDGVGDPEGWYRNPTTGRRRPGNDPEREIIAP